MIHTWRQLLTHQRETFADHLPRAIDVDTPVKRDIDKRQSDAGDRAHADHARHAVHIGFNRIGDELLHLFRRHPACFNHDRDGGLIEIGKYIDRHAGEREGTKHHHHHRQHHHN